MDERERIRKMVEDGKLTTDEAERLISVLTEIDDADASLELTARSVETEAEQIQRTGVPAASQPDEAAAVDSQAVESQRLPRPPSPRPPSPPPHDPPSDRGTDAAASSDPEWADDIRSAVDAAGRAAGQAVSGVGRAVSEVGRAVFGEADGAAEGVQAARGQDAAAGSTASDCAPVGTRWLHVALVAADLSVRADPSLTEPVLTGDTERITLEATDDGFRVGQRNSDGDWIGPFLSHLARAGKTDLDLRVPPEFGLEIRMTAGDLSLDGVAFLRGRLTAGDVDAKGLLGIDFTTAAGDVDVEIKPQAGHHRLHVSAGDVNARLLPGSNVTLSGSVSIGEASVSGAGLESERRGLGHRLHGVLGSGDAHLELKVTTGELSVKARDA